MSSNLEQQENYGLALYHPHIHVKDVNWLKSTLLYWDEIKRIVPSNFPSDQDDEEYKEDPQGSEILEAIKAKKLTRIEPDKYVDEAQNQFLQSVWDLQNQQTHNPVNDLLTNIKKSYERLTGRNDATVAALQNLLQELTPGQYTDMYQGKMRPELSKLFKLAGLAYVDNQNFFMLNRSAADLYMMCLATVIKQKVGMPLISDYTGYEETTKFLDFGQANNGQNLSSVLNRLGIEWPSPEELADYPISKILKFHEEHESARRRFRIAIDKMVLKATQLDEIDEVRSDNYLKNEAKELKDAYENHKDKMKSVGIKGLTSLLAVTAPTVLTTTVPAIAKTIAPAVVLDPLFGGILTATGITFSLITWWATVKQQRREEQKNQWHYLLAIEKQFPNTNR